MSNILRQALRDIAAYDAGGGCCQYGCDCPTIAIRALDAENRPNALRCIKIVGHQEVITGYFHGFFDSCEEGSGPYVVLEDENGKVIVRPAYQAEFTDRKPL